MKMYLLPLALFAFLSPALITGWSAVNNGRSFWKWFMIGCILPVISHFLLILVLPAERKFFRH